MLEFREHYIWVEKYRPTNFDNYIGNEHMVTKVKGYINSGEIPMLLLNGSPGVGKTTISKIIVNSIECDYLYINASDENNVETVRTKIKSFASTIGFKPLKIIILDECDMITFSGQTALRSIMETFSLNCRFILTCNYVEKILPALVSRCQTFTAVAPTKPEVAKHCVKILDLEKVTYQKEDLALIINSCYPDIRKVINTLQSYVVDGKLTPDKQTIVENNYLLKLFEILKTTDKNESKFRLIRQLIADSHVKQFEDLYKYFYDNVDELTKNHSIQSSIILILAEAQYYDSLVVDKEINVMSALIKILNEL